MDEASSTRAAGSTARADAAWSAALDGLCVRVDAWHALDAPARARLLRACAARLDTRAEAWVAAACRTKGLDPQSALAGEEWVGGVAVSLRALRLFAETLAGRWPVEDLPSELLVPRDAERAQPADEPRARRRVRVFPRRLAERLMLPGVTADVELEDDGPVARAPRPATGGVAVVLGAGNVDSILVHDLLDQLLRHDRVVLLKFNPVNAGLRPVFEEVFAPLIEGGFLTCVEADADSASRLVVDARVDHVHLTGSIATFEKVVWGADEAERERRRAADEPRVGRPGAEGTSRAGISAELGAVTPILVVPGAWSTADLRFQARNLAAMAGHNASCNCNAAKLIVTARDWPQRTRFLRLLREALAALPPRPAWYPGCAARWQRFREAYPQGEEIAPVGGAAPGPAPEAADSGASPALPWLFVPDVPLRRQELACNTEAFAPVLAEASVAARTPEEFLARAVDPVNEEVYGTLSCGLIAAAHAPRAELDDAIARLRYGAVAVNVWPGLAFGLGQATWGAFPGHTLHEPGSGLDHVHNTLQLARARRTILRGPFRPLLRPAYDPAHRRLPALGRAWARYEAAPSFARLMALAWPALRG